MSIVVPRTCTVIADGDADPSRAGSSRPRCVPSMLGSWEVKVFYPT